MSFARGERFYLNLDPDGEQDTPAASARASIAAFGLVADVTERTPSTTKPPAAPASKPVTTATGFPAHRKRARISKFRQEKAAEAARDASIGDGKAASIGDGKITSAGDERAASTGDGVDASAASDHVSAPRPAVLGRGVPRSALAQEEEEEEEEEEERLRIDAENRQRLSEMSPEEIERERQELFAGLPPSLIERLLKRSNIDAGSNEVDFLSNPPRAPLEPPEAERPPEKPKPAKKVAFEIPKPAERPAASSEPDRPPPADPAPPSGSVHFPRPPAPPELDPDSANFLEDLHAHYFPDLPHDPASLGWMAPPDPHTSPYSPALASLPASSLRFDFKGRLVPPRRARELPVTAGLHHHGDAPEAAGYTIPELARLARSVVPGQRCIAYRTLGRILYRLGKGEFGIEEGGMDTVDAVLDGSIGDGAFDVLEDPTSVGGTSEMARGLWVCMEEGHVLETLMEEAGRDKGHLSARTYAQEALWSWRRGGGRKRKAV